MNERISIKPDVCNGRPVVRGTRITVQTVLEFLAAGDSVEDVLEEYPKLTRADVQRHTLQDVTLAVIGMQVAHLEHYAAVPR